MRSRYVSPGRCSLAPSERFISWARAPPSAGEPGENSARLLCLLPHYESLESSDKGLNALPQYSLLLNKACYKSSVRQVVPLIDAVASARPSCFLRMFGTPPWPPSSDTCPSCRRLGCRRKPCEHGLYPCAAKRSGAVDAVWLSA